MNFTILEQEEFREFLEKSPLKSHLQTPETAKLKEMSNWKSHYVGVKNNNGEIIAGTMMVSIKHGFSNEFYAMRGPIIDFNNYELLKFFTDNIKKYILDNNGYMLRIDPYLIYHSRNRDGEITGEIDNEKAIQNLLKLGYKQVKSINMNDTIQPRFMYVIELEGKTLEDVLNEMTSKTRQMIRKNEKNCIKIRKGNYDDLNLFVDIMNKTGERRHFNDRGLEFYQNMYKALSPKNMIEIVFAEIDILEALENLDKEVKEINKNKLDREEKHKDGKVNEKKYLAKQKEDEESFKRIEKRRSELLRLQKEYGNLITLGGILYINYGDEVASVFGGVYDEFLPYQPFYTIHNEMIKYAVENSYKRYNFYAICNSLSPDDEQYGIYQFKKSFGGHVQEYIGEFLLPVKKCEFNLHELKRKIRK